MDHNSEKQRAPVATVKLRRGQIRWLVRAGYDVSAFEELLSDPDGQIARSEHHVRDGWLVSITRIFPSNAAGKSWLLRKTKYAKPLARVRDFFRAAAPIRAFRNALEFERAQIPTPPVIAAGIVRKFQKPVSGYLLVEEISPALSLEEYLKKHGGIPGAAIRRSALSIAQMHDRGLFHGDLNITNVLLDSQLQPWLVDLERGRKSFRPVSWRGAVEDFFRFARHVPTLGPGARFAALRLLKEYCRERDWSGREREFSADVFARLKQKVKGYGQNQ